MISRGQDSELSLTMIGRMMVQGCELVAPVLPFDEAAGQLPKGR